MATELFDEYRQCEPRAKLELELIDGKLVVSKSLTHSCCCNRACTVGDL